MLRFATSPTEDMHIGTLRIAILSYLVAQQNSIGFTVRINDTDNAKNIEGKDTEILQILEKFALKHDAVFHQSEHFHMHHTLALKLLQQDKAFVCTCANTEGHYSGCCENVDKSAHAKLKDSGTPFVIRIKKPKQPVVIDDLIQGDISMTPKEVDSFVILHTDGTPSGTFASACDDMISGITTVIEDESQITKSARAIHIKTALGYQEETIHAHLATIQKAPTLIKLFAEGFVPDAIINYLLLLTNPDTPEQLFTLPEAIEWFDLENISKSPTTFNIDRLRLINREHLRAMDNKILSTLFGFADADIGKLAKLFLEDASTINELAEKIRMVFAPKTFLGTYKEQMRILEQIIQDAPMFSEFNEFTAYIMQESGLQNEKLMKPLRLLLTGATHGPELSDVYPLIKSYLLEIAS